uniref:tRNA wybutosine-synthesizing protein 1 n=1 Tax=Anthurium amnicola TaxID=1678845 RepID=A0A1D1XWE8_9ARAE
MTTASPLTSLPARLALLTFFSLSSFFFLYKSRRLRQLRLASLPTPSPRDGADPRGKLFFASETGTSEALARRLLRLLSSEGLAFDLVDPSGYEPEDLQKENVVLMVASTWEDGRPPPNAEFLARWLSESAEDFRVGSILLARCKFAVFGVGSRSYGEGFNAAARGFSRWMRALGASEILPVGEGDVDAGDVDEVFGSWSTKVVRLLKGDLHEKDRRPGLNLENGTLEGSEEEEDYDEDEEELESAMADMEDIAGKGPSRKSSAASRNGDVTGEKKLAANGDLNGVKEMVNPIIRMNLERQGYKIIGSHSGVKLCRWTKSQLRGRGGCYKHSFYGIESHSIS